MNKREFIERMATMGYTKKDAACLIEDVLRIISETLVAGDEVRFWGFGTFSVHENAAHEAVDFQSQERRVVPAYKSPKFTAGKLLKRAVKEGLLRK